MRLGRIIHTVTAHLLGSPVIRSRRLLLLLVKYREGATAASRPLMDLVHAAVVRWSALALLVAMPVSLSTVLFGSRSLLRNVLLLLSHKMSRFARIHVAVAARVRMASRVTRLLHQDNVLAGTMLLFLNALLLGLAATAESLTGTRPSRL